MQDNEAITSNLEDAHLEALRRREGLESIEQVIEWLVKTSIRDSAKRITGRGRALYDIKGKSK